MFTNNLDKQIEDCNPVGMRLVSYLENGTEVVRVSTYKEQAGVFVTDLTLYRGEAIVGVTNRHRTHEVIRATWYLLHKVHNGVVRSVLDDPNFVNNQLRRMRGGV